LCGAYHGFMPIEVQITSLENYLSWISSLSLIPLFITNSSTYVNNKVIKN
jgi:heme/copper-type cytochrome/quinol oxidase subunit 2